jgi:hypothetical protein
MVEYVNLILELLRHTLTKFLFDQDIQNLCHDLEIKTLPASKSLCFYLSILQTIIQPVSSRLLPKCPVTGYLCQRTFTKSPDIVVWTMCVSLATANPSDLLGGAACG